MSTPHAPRQGERVFKGERGEIRTWFAGPDVIVFKYSGHSTVDMGAFVIKVADAELAKGRHPDFFVDAEELASYAPEMRTQITEWASRVRPQVGSWGFLVRSKLVSMAISVGSIFVRNLESFSTRASFERAIDEAVRRRRDAASAGL